MKQKTKQSLEKIQNQINEEYDKFDKKVKPLRDKIKELEESKMKRDLEKNKDIIFTKSYGKRYVVFKILKSIKRDKFQYKRITIEDSEEYSIHYIKESRYISKKEFKEICERFGK